MRQEFPCSAQGGAAYRGVVGAPRNDKAVETGDVFEGRQRARLGDAEHGPAPVVAVRRVAEPLFHAVTVVVEADLRRERFIVVAVQHGDADHHRSARWYGERRARAARTAGAAFDVRRVRCVSQKARSRRAIR